MKRLQQKTMGKPVVCRAFGGAMFTLRCSRRALAVLLCAQLAAATIGHAETAAAADATQESGAPTESVLRRGETLLAAGHHPRALAELERAFGAISADAEPGFRARLGALLGKALSLSGRQEEAIKRLEEALAISRKEGLETVRAAILNDLGNARAASGASPGAIAAFVESSTVAGASGASLLGAKAATNGARAHFGNGDLAEAARWSSEALRLLALAPADSAENALVHIAAARVMLDLYGKLGDLAWLTRAHAALTNAANTAERLADARTLSYAYGYLGQSYEAERRDADALVLTRRAIFAAQQARADESLYRWHWQAARILRRQGLENDATEAYRRAISTVWPIRQDVMADARRLGLSYQATLGALFQETAELLIDQSSKAADRKTSQALLLAARDSIEQLKTTELEDYYQDDCVAAVQAKQKDIDHVGAKTAVIYPIIFPSRTELLVTLPEGIQRFSVPVGAAPLAQEVFELRRRLEKRTTHQYLPHAQRVYDWLIRPLESVLAAQSVDTLVMIPDGPLRNIPLASLHDGKRFLAERFAVAVAPGLTLIEPRQLAHVPIRPLLAGLSQSVQKFPSLPHVDSELADIKALYGGTVLRNQAFTADGFKRELRDKNYSVVHIASHAQFEPESRRSFLLAYDGKLTMDGLEPLLRLSRFRDEPVELLTLSACGTAAGNERSALGLAGVAVKAGARSALATLWYVNDQAASYLVTNFYRQLSDPSLSKAKALQAAQLQMLGERRYRHPGYWSPFLLIGNWL